MHSRHLYGSSILLSSGDSRSLCTGCMLSIVMISTCTGMYTKLTEVYKHIVLSTVTSAYSTRYIYIIIHMYVLASIHDTVLIMYNKHYNTKQYIQ